MLIFLDGPAKDTPAECLLIRRAPLFLRLTCKGVPHKWDALDQPADVPLCGEAVFAYRREGKASAFHLKASGASGYFAMASYKFVANQPPESVLRDNTLWQAWCVEAAKVVTVPDGTVREPGKCRSCGAAVLFVPSESTGTLMCLNAEPRKGGNVLLIGGKARVVKGSLFEGATGPLYLSHHADCPSAAKHRKAR